MPTKKEKAPAIALADAQVMPTTSTSMPKYPHHRQASRPQAAAPAPDPQLPTLRSLVKPEDFASDDDEFVLMDDLVGEVCSAVTRRAGERLMAAAEAIRDNADQADMLFLVSAVENWKKHFEEEGCQPGALLAAILREFGLDSIGEGVRDRRSNARALEAARKRLTEAGVPFLQEGGAA